MSMDGFVCAVCDSDDTGFVWTDTHGVARHEACGAVYRIYHYDDNDKPEDKPPTLLIKPDWLPYVRRYWQEERRSVWGGASSFIHTPEEIADAKALGAWFNANVPAELLGRA